MSTLVFVRHGQASLFAADYDELSPRGRDQARALGEHLAARGVCPDRVWTGPARRQRDTAALVAEAARARGVAWPDPDTLPEIDEHDAFGMLAAVAPTLASDPQIAPHQAALAAASDPAQRSAAFQRMFEVIMARWLVGAIDSGGAETWPVFRDRVESGLRRIVGETSRGASVFLFSSVGPLAVLLRRALAIGDLDSFRTAWRCRNAAMSRFVFSGDERFTLDAFNDLSHLPDPAFHTFR